MNRVVKDTFKVFFDNVIPILFIVLIVAIPVEWVKNYYFVNDDDSFFSILRRDGIVGLLFLSIISPVVIHYIYHKGKDEAVTLSNSFLRGFRIWPRIVLYRFVKNIVVFAGLVFFIVPGVIFYLRLYFVDIVVTIEGSKGQDPLGRSKAISQGYLKSLIWNVIVLTLIIALPILLIVFMIYVIDVSWVGDTLVDLMFDLASVLYLILGLQFYLRINGASMEQYPK